LAVVPAKRIAVLLSFGLAAGAYGALYKWTDENGRVQYSDKPPASDKGGVQMSNRGVVMKKLDGGLTPEQKKAKDDELARKKIEEASAAEQRRQDTALLQSFTSVKEIEMKRDREIQALDAAVVNLRSQERTVIARIEDDRRRAESYSKSKKPVPDSVKEDIARGEAERKVIEEETKRKHEEIAATRAKYDALRKRYMELKDVAASGIQPVSAAPSAPAKK
jgi:hypothetical protein